MLFHDESIFAANEDQWSQWDEKDNFTIKPKSKHSGIILWYQTLLMNSMITCVSMIQNILLLKVNIETTLIIESF